MKTIRPCLLLLLTAVTASAQDAGTAPVLTPESDASGVPDHSASALGSPEAAETDTSEVLPENEASSVPSESAVSEDPNNWQYLNQLTIPSAEVGAADSHTSRLFDIVLTPQIFSQVRSDLADLRLFDSAGQTVPYALRYLRPQSIQDQVPAVEFNRSQSESGTQELTLDLQSDEIRHNEVRILTDGENFRRPAVIDGSDDGKKWKRLAAANLIRFSHEDQKVIVDSVSYPESRYRYLRIQVEPDHMSSPPEESESEDTSSSTDDRSFTISEAMVLRQVSLPGEQVTRDAVVHDREPGRANGTPSSSWIVDLGGQNVPCDRLEVMVENREFVRDIEVQAEFPSFLPGQTSFMSLSLNEGMTWQRQLGDAKKAMIVTFAEVQTSRLRLTVVDHSNVPLTISAVRFSAAARQIVFAEPAQADHTVTLYSGNPSADLPRYDFDRNLSAELTTAPIRCIPEASTQNPGFTPPPKPFSERFPWLIYVVLTSVIAVLAFVISRLAGTAISLHDAAQLPGV